MPRGSSCKAKGCTSNKNDNPELSFHSFPRNKERFKLWCDLINRPDLNHGKAISSRMSMRVCSLHFDDHMYMSPNNKSRLIWCAVPKPLKVTQAGETTSVTHLLPKPAVMGKATVYSSFAEDIVIKEESVMDEDTGNDFFEPSCCPLESSIAAFTDTKVGILEESQSGQVGREAVESKSCQGRPKNHQVSHPAGLNASEHRTSHSSVRDFEGFGSSLPPSENPDETSSCQEKDGSVKMYVVNELRQPFKELDSEQDTCKSSKLLNDESPGSEDQTCISASTKNQPSTNRQNSLSALSLRTSLPQSSCQHNLTGTPSSTSDARKVLVPHNTTKTPPQSKEKSAGHQSAAVTQQILPSSCDSVLQETRNYKRKKTDAGVRVADAVTVSKEVYEKTRANVETCCKTGGNGCSAGCCCRRCAALAGEKRKRDGAVKSNTMRTYSGPIRRQVVRTKTGAKKTILIVNKASLKNLQAKGILPPITTKGALYKHGTVERGTARSVSVKERDESSKKRSEDEDMVSHVHGLQTVRKSAKSAIPSAPVSTSDDNDVLNQPLKSGQSDAFLSPNEADSSSKSSRTQTQPGTESCIETPSESDAKSRDQPHSSHTTQTLNPQLQTPRQETQAPVTVSWAPVSGSNALSFTFTVTLPSSIGTEGPPGAHQDPLQIATSVLNKGAQCTVNQPNAPARDAFDSNRSTGDQSSGNSGTVQGTGTRGSQESVPVRCITSGSASQCPCRVGSLAASSNPVLPHEVGSEERETRCSKGPEESKVALDKPSKTRPINTNNVQWIAVPSGAIQHALPSPSSAAKQVHQVVLARKGQMSNTALHSGKRLHILPRYRSTSKELKAKYTNLLSKHRRRYYLLMKKHKALEEKYSAVKDAGTPQQILRDAGKFLSREHVLFLESQMFLRNRPGTGNRFSREFIKLMMQYYKRSAAGYRYLKTIFTIPSVKTLKKWLNKAFESGLLDDNSPQGSREDSEMENDERTDAQQDREADGGYENSVSYKNSKVSVAAVRNVECEDDLDDDNSVDDYNSEDEFSFEEMQLDETDLSS